MKFWTRRLPFALLMVGVAVWLSGCLDASYFFLARYDDAKDEFAVMNVYQQIASPTPGDSQYLYQLWLNRDHLIRVPNIDIFAKPAFLRLSANRYADINLGQAPKMLEPKGTGVSLDKIRVMPGAFFLRGPDTLCYYDQVVIPGTVVDQTLARIPNSIAPYFAKGIDEEIKRRQDGGKRTSWEEARALLLKQLHAAFVPPPPAAAPPNPNEEPSNLLWMLDEESLKLARDGGMKFSREKQLFRFVFSISDADAVQIDQIWHAAVDAVNGEAAKPAENATTSPVLVAKMLTAFNVATQPRAIELKIDLAIILKNLPLLSSLVAPLANPAPEDQTKMRAAIAALMAHGVPIDDTITVEQLAKDFMAGSLKSYPSQHPVTPGSGLVQGANNQGEATKP